MEEQEYVCGPCRVGRKVHYPVDDRELCPVLPWHSQCPDCGQEMTPIPPGLSHVDARIFELELVERHHGPLDPNRLDLDGVKRELERRARAGLAPGPGAADPAARTSPAAGPQST